MDIVVKGRRTDVADRFREHAAEKLEKVGKLDHKVIRIDVEVSRERNPRLASFSDRVEITCRSRGPVIRAEAASTDPYAALDLAMDKLESRLRRAADRRRVHHGSRTPVSVAAATADTAEALPDFGDLARAGWEAPADEEPSWLYRQENAHVHDSSGQDLDGTGTGERGEGERLVPMDMDGDGPLVVREKTHRAVPMDLDRALFEMELVGHDFYLFVDEGTGRPSVVYRRRGYDYGVLRLDP